MLNYVHGIYRIADMEGKAPAGAQEDCTTASYFELVPADDIAEDAEELNVLYADNLNCSGIDFNCLVFYKNLTCRFKTLKELEAMPHLIITESGWSDDWDYEDEVIEEVSRAEIPGDIEEYFYDYVKDCYDEDDLDDLQNRLDSDTDICYRIIDSDTKEALYFVWESDIIEDMLAKEE